MENFSHLRQRLLPLIRTKIRKYITMSRVGQAAIGKRETP